MTLPTPTSSTLECRKLILTNNECVCFVGAGISIPPSKDWRKFVQAVAKKLKVEFDDNNGEADYLLTTIDRCIEKDISECNQVLRQLLPELTVVTRTALLKLLRFPLKAIATTNFDLWIRENARSGQFPRGISVYPDLPAKDGIQGRIYHLHGIFAADDTSSTVEELVLGKHSFEAAYSENSILPSFLLNMFVYENVLFIGFDPLEPKISSLLLRSIHIRRSIQSHRISSEWIPPRRFILTQARRGGSLEKTQQESERLSRFAALEIEPVFFDGKVPKFGGIEEILRSWEDGLAKDDQPPGFASGFKPTQGSVLG